MRIYAFLDVDGGLQWRTSDYIENVNPAFWIENSTLILRTWPIDTDDLHRMKAMLHDFSDMRLTQSVVRDFLVSINFDIEAARNASSV
jgi:hypothetical protein